jgi:signal transduction histidine kinase
MTRARQPLATNSSAEIGEILPIPMAQFDGKGDLVLMNQAFRDLLASMKASSTDLPRLLPSDYRTLIKRILEEKSSEEHRSVFEGRTLHLVFKSSGVGAYLFVLDMTLQEEVKAQLNQSEKMASLGLLTAGLAHEINTPLGAIHSNNDTISRSIAKIRQLLQNPDAPDGSAARRNVGRLVDLMGEVCENTSIATERLIGIVSSLKNFTRLDEPDRMDADLHEGIDSTLTIVQHQFRNRIRVEKEYGDIPTVECYPNRLNQVFMNLLVNAAQAIPERGTVTIRTSKTEDSVRIAISDTGVGIPNENLSKIFDPGFTTKGVGVGTGLGLPICYKIIQEHQGKIEVESSDRGTTFTIVLPLRQARKVQNG